MGPRPDGDARRADDRRPQPRRAAGLRRLHPGDRRPLAPSDGRERSDPDRCLVGPLDHRARRCRRPARRRGADRAVSRFAVVDARLGLGYAPRIIELEGAFDFDALSPDGRLLYVAQQVPGPLEGRYQVRAVETTTGVMRDAIIVDKRNLDEQMAGWPIDQERRVDGMVMTLYRGIEYPFVHALSSVDAWAVCIDLPTRRHSRTPRRLPTGASSALAPGGAILPSTRRSAWRSRSTRPS